MGAIAQRIHAAAANFVENVMEQFDKTEEDAWRVLAVFLAANAVKLDPVLGRPILTHGAYWEQAVIDRAAESGIAPRFEQARLELV